MPPWTPRGKSLGRDFRVPGACSDAFAESRNVRSCVFLAVYLFRHLCTVTSAGPTGSYILEGGELFCSSHVSSASSTVPDKKKGLNTFLSGEMDRRRLSGS